MSELTDYSQYIDTYTLDSMTIFFRWIFEHCISLSLGMMLGFYMGTKRILKDINNGELITKQTHEQLLNLKEEK